MTEALKTVAGSGTKNLLAKLAVFAREAETDETGGSTEPREQ